MNILTIFLSTCDDYLNKSILNYIIYDTILEITLNLLEMNINIDKDKYNQYEHVDS